MKQSSAPNAKKPHTRKQKTASRQKQRPHCQPSFNYQRSCEVAIRSHAQWGHCYESAYRACFAEPRLFFPRGLFIEGWVVFEYDQHVLLMEHGWLLSERQLIDPTIVFVVEPGQAVYHFPGVQRTWTELEALEGEFFPHVRFSGYGEDGMDHVPYKTAYQRARQKAEELASPDKAIREVRASDPNTHGYPSSTLEDGVIAVGVVIVPPDSFGWERREKSGRGDQPPTDPV